MSDILAWLGGLPPFALYLALAVAAAVENVFPPIPADTVVAFGAFLSSRGDATPIGTFAATWIGNIAGALFVMLAARHYGAQWLSRRLERFGGEKREEQLRRMYDKHGTIALFVSRFIPGARALVPPVAGALRLPVFSTMVVIAIASGLWYGAITWLAYRLGADWETLQSRIAELSKATAIAAGLVVLLGIAIWLIKRRRSSAAGAG